MKKLIGIWIDRKNAVIIAYDGRTENIERVSSPIETRTRVPDEVRELKRFGNHFFRYETASEHRLEHQKQEFFRDIAGRLREADEVVLFGPSMMKVELRKYLLSDHNIGAQLDPVENAGRLTENQMAAWVRSYYLTHVKESIATA